MEIKEILKIKEKIVKLGEDDIFKILGILEYIKHDILKIY